jgi:hypothetical protein
MAKAGFLACSVSAKGFLLSDFSPWFGGCFDGSHEHGVAISSQRE